MEDNKQLVPVVNKLLTLISTKGVGTDVISSPEFLQQYDLFEEQLKQANEVKKAIDGKIKEVIETQYLEKGETTFVAGDRKFTYIPEGTRITVDSEKLQKDFPEIYSQCVKVGRVSSSLRTAKSKKK